MSAAAPYTGGRMGRFEDPQDPLFQALNASIGFDLRLAPYDLRQSLAHARMLARTGVITEADRDALARGLDEVRGEIEEGRFAVEPGDEDVHMAIERRVTEIAGPVGGKLHTARSRNDQVATDMALLVRDHAGRARALLLELMGVLAGLAERHLDWPLPGYTHLQRAQPVYLSHHLLAHFWRFARDRERFGACLAATRRAAARRGRPRRRELRHRPAHGGRRARASPRSRRTRSTRSRTATSCSTTSPRRPPAPPICPSSAERSSSGRARSSASARSPTPSPPAPA